MSFVRSPDMERLWAQIVLGSMVLTSVMIAFLLLWDTSAPVHAAPPATGQAYQAADEQVPSEAAEAEHIGAEQMPAEHTPADQTPGEPAAPRQNPDVPAAKQIPAREQTVLKSRRALETVDPRELLRQGAVPPATTPN